MAHTSTRADRASSCPPAVAQLVSELGVTPESNLITVLQQAQGRLGYLPPEALEEISRRTRVPLSTVYSVVTFYSDFHTEPRGRHLVRCCNGTACHVSGAERVLGALEEALDIAEGESTPDLCFALETVGCLGICCVAPALMVDDQCHGRVSPEDVAGILARSREAGR